MTKQNVQRRDFLKTVGCFIAGIFVLRFTGTSSRREEMDPKKENQPGLKEAQYYSRGNHLAG